MQGFNTEKVGRGEGEMITAGDGGGFWSLALAQQWLQSEPSSITHSRKVCVVQGVVVMYST